MSANNLRDASHNLHEQLARPQAPRGNSIMSTTPINEAGIKWPDKVLATFAAIFARLEELEHGQEDHHTRLERLESARIAAPTAPESTETGPGVPMEPGTQCGTCKGTGRFLDWGDMGAPKPCPECAEVAAALRMYRKVQRLQACDDIFGFGVKMDTFLHFQYAAPLLAWLKEGEA